MSVTAMKKRVELPLLKPLYSTYHYQGSCTAVLRNNPTIKNWFLNNSMILSCNRSFLGGYTTPEITVLQSNFYDCPYIEKIMVSTEFAKGYINPIIRAMLDKGIYVAFSNVDDYYIEGKSWYKERHFSHDGLLCGYDRNDKTYCMYAYDSKWMYRKFWTPQSGFNKGMFAMRKKGSFTYIAGLRVKKDKIEFSPETVLEKLKKCIGSDLEKYPFSGLGNVYGMVVHKYISEYVMRLYRGDIPYERMDRRVFRVIWEQKAVMLERIIKIEQVMGFDNKISTMYAPLVKDADLLRMLYASHHMKRRDSLLPVISKKLIELDTKERVVLTELIEKMEKEFEKNAVELSQKKDAK